MHSNIKQLSKQISNGDFLSLAKAITIVENELPGYQSLLMNPERTHNPQIVGITGPPGAGKSTLLNDLLHYWLKQNKKIAVIAIDPSSPFNYGALLGDRIRMSEFYTNPNVFIRSFASRGALGGLNAKIIEITDVVKQAPFDLIIIETVGVGQSEVEIAGLADCTVVVLVPEAGDEVQTIKAGIMEIADVFVVNKADREAAEALYRNLRILVHERAGRNKETPVIKTIATEEKGIEELAAEIDNFMKEEHELNEKRKHLLVEKSWQLMQAHRMKNIDRAHLSKELAEALKKSDFNLYAFTENFLEKNSPGN